MAYSVKQEAVLREAAKDGPITFARAQELGLELGYSYQSVIAKIKSLELPYERKPVEPKRPKGMTKADLVKSILARLNQEGLELNGLEKATSQSLSNLLEAL
jgi:hypothetical protein